MALLTEEEFERLKATPFDDLTDNEKAQLNLRLMDDLPDEQFSLIFEMMLSKIIKNYHNLPEQ